MTVPFLHDDMRREYERWIALAGKEDPYASKSTVGLHDVLLAHFLIVDFFIEAQYPVGGIGPKSLDLLHSSCFRQFSAFDGVHKWKDPLKRCASLLYGLVMNHPFHDANKRTAFLVTLWQLDRLSRTPRTAAGAFDEFIVEIANHEIERYAAYQAHLKSSPDPAIEFIAEILRKNTRPIDRRIYTVTYHELNQILHRYNCELADPDKNHINIVRYEVKKSALPFFGRSTTEKLVIGQIGFPGWKRQVGRGAIDTVRKVTGLTADHGFDSQVFFYNDAPVAALIDAYSEPLRRLANR